MDADALRKRLNTLIDGLCAGDLSVPDFQAAYYHLQLETCCPEMSAHERDYYSAIREQLDWTVPTPDPDDRGYGYLDEQGYRQFVRDLRERFERGDPSPFLM